MVKYMFVNTICFSLESNLNKQHRCYLPIPKISKQIFKELLSDGTKVQGHCKGQLMDREI